MDSIREETDLQAEMNEREAVQEALSGNAISPGNGKNEGSLRGDARRGEEAIARSLMSGHLETDEGFDNGGGSGGAKRPLTSPLSHSRLKKKRTVQQTAADSQTSALLQSLVPKLGPTFRVKPDDSDQRSKAVEGIQSGHQQSIESGLNFLMAWSLVEKGAISNKDIVDVISVLIDFTLKVLTAKPASVQEQIESCLEDAQYTTMFPDAILQCMAAGLILKNLSLSLVKPVDLGSTGPKIVHFLTCMLDKKVPNSDEDNGCDLLVLKEVPHSLIRDVLQLAKVLSVLDESNEVLMNLIVKTVCNKDLPLRLRTVALDILSSFLYQHSMKDALISTLQDHCVELKLHLKMFMMLPLERALKEAEFEFEGGLDYDGIAVFEEQDHDRQQRETKMWAWRLQSEGLLSGVTFLTALASADILELFATDQCILQVLVDMTTGKKLLDIVGGEKSLLESKLEVMMSIKRNVRSSEMQSYRLILDTLQKPSSPIKDRLRRFEDQFVVSAFDNTWQAKQCAMVLAMMNGNIIHSNEISTDL